MQRIQFNAKADSEFIRTLRVRVADYFKTNGISRHANATMVIKTIFMILLYFVPFAFVLSPLSINPWIHIGLWCVMGFGTAGIGLSVMHDANHGAYSKNQKVNHLIGYIVNFVGGNAATWRMQHNVLHHSFTNIDGHDEDIAPPGFLRFSPHQERKKIHRLQHWYAWFFYSLMTISWMSSKEFAQLFRYKKMGITNSEKLSFNQLFVELTLTKTFYLAYALVLPLILAPVAWWVVLIGFVIMHLIAGLLLACVFQPAHVMPTTEYPIPDEKGTIDNNWAVHQLLTTTNFAPKSRWFGWYVGGLNFQIEHHLFPNICHVHYPKLSVIVQSTAEEFGLPYHSERTFASALRSHTRMLRDLGRKD